MSVGDLPLSKIFWTVFALAAAISAFMVFKAVESVEDKSSTAVVMVAFIALVPITGLALVAGLFLAFKAPGVRVGLILLMLFPLWGPVVAFPIHHVRDKLRETSNKVWQERERVGKHLFLEAGPRELAAAIADRDPARIRAALPLAGDLNRLYRPYGKTSRGQETLLSFALWSADESDASAEVIELLLSAGADPNLPRGTSMLAALRAGTRVAEILRRAGGDINASFENRDAPVWWSILEYGERGTTDVKMLRYLLDHGADTRKREAHQEGPVELAVEGERWAAVALLAAYMPGVKDMVIGRNPNLDREGETVHARLAREVQALQQADRPLPDGMREALAAFGTAAP